MSQWIRRIVRLALCVLAAVGAWVAFDRVGYDPQPWLADLRALEDSTAAGYANLEWQVRRGVVDPVALHRLTDSTIRHAGSRRTARLALVQFGEAFHDGHYHLRRPIPSAVAWIGQQLTGQRDQPPVINLGAIKGCAALGYRDDASSSLMASHPDYQELGPPTAPFPAGMINAERERIGVIRIGSFGVDRYGGACARAWPGAVTADSSGTCASQCQDALWLGTSDSLLAALGLAIGRVRDAGATVVVVDLIDNGGGTDWVSAAARLFSDRPIRGHIAALVRHPHHESRLEVALTEMRAARGMTHDSLWRTTLDSAIARATHQLSAVKNRCDRRAIWTDGIDGFACTQLASEQFTTGFIDYLPPSAHALPGVGDVFSPAQFAYQEGVWHGPLVLLVNHGTASASEDFVVALHDGAGAVVMGERTYGAGCGYTSGGIGFRLRQSGLDVAMPDCARIRRGGENEVSGIEPSIPLTEMTADAVLRAITTRRDP